MEYIKNSDEYKNIIVYDKKRTFDSLAKVQPYTSILAKGKCGVLVEKSLRDIPIDVTSYYKISKLASVIPEEYIRFTLYITEPEKDFSTTPKESDRLNIPEYSSVYHKLEVETKAPGEPENQTSYQCINPAMFVASKKNSSMLNIYRCVYPLYFLAAATRLYHLIYFKELNSEVTLYKILNNLQLLLLCILGAFGMYVMRSWNVSYLSLLNILVIIAFFLSGLICVYGYKNIEYVVINKNYHFLFYVLVLLLDVVAFVDNIFIKKEYERYSPYEKKTKLVTRDF